MRLVAFSGTNIPVLQYSQHRTVAEEIGKEKPFAVAPNEPFLPHVAKKRFLHCTTNIAGWNVP